MENGKIYKIINSETNGLYVGCTINTLKQRFEEHCYRCLKTNINTKLCNSIRKYGVEKFTIELIEECSLDVIYTREVELIREHNSFESGLNSTIGGEGCLGYKHSPEIRLKISNAVKNGNSRKGKTYEEIYGEKANEEKEKRKKAGWSRILNEEEKLKVVEKIKTERRKTAKYDIDTINEVKKLLQVGERVVNIHKQYPSINISTIYCIKQGRRWKD